MTEKMEAETVYDHRHPAAGRIWIVPHVQMIDGTDGTRVMTDDETRRVSEAIANEICGRAGSLSVEELDFLCELTGTPLAEVASRLNLHKSTLSKWRAAGRVSKVVFAYNLKKLFWFRIFGTRVGEEQVPIRFLQEERTLLHYLRERAIREHLAEPMDHLRLRADGVPPTA